MIHSLSNLTPLIPPLQLNWEWQLAALDQKASDPARMNLENLMVHIIKLKTVEKMVKKRKPNPVTPIAKI
jgi:hypothetical protein